MSEMAGNTAVAFEYPKEAIISYAQTHEDVLLWRALHSVGAGFYVDVGAHDPTDLSVTRAFYERGWRGINIEPNPGYAKKLREQRPRDVTLEVALGDQHGEATIYDFGATGLSTIVTEIAKDHLSTGLQPVEFRVPLTTLATALADLRDQEIHFLKIDVEGYERQVLSGADFKRHRPWIVLLEAVRPMTSIPTHSAWEPILLNAGYQFAYFDGLNRYYVSNEHANLKRYFSVPVSIADPYRDYGVVRLSEAITELKRDKMRHEVPRLGSDPRVSDPTDAAGLLWIVEAQASDLVRLRRALLAQRSNAAERNDAEASAPEPEVSHWIRSIALADLHRTQAAIADIIERTGWRRLGQRLGLEKQLGWETGHWKSDLLNAKDDNGRAATPSLEPLLFEVKRMSGLLNELARSRWLKLGHWLGFAKYAAGRSDLYGDPLLLEDFPPEAGKEFPAKARAKASPSSYEGFVELTNQRFWMSVGNSRWT
jgi:FkbM family methyltransferase